LKNRRAEQVLLYWGGVGTCGREGGGGERVWEGEHSANTVHMYVKGKMIPVETIPGIRGRGDKGKW
jgi:hypothetical protein